MMFRNTFQLDEGWAMMQKAIEKLTNILEEQLPEQEFCSEETMMLNTTIYNMCTQKPSNNCSQQLYDKYRGVLEEHITSVVLPSLKKNHGEFMLRELVERWQKYKGIVCWLSKHLFYLDRYLVARRSLPTLNEVGLTCFRDLVYQEMNGKVRDAIISLIEQEREGGQLDRALLKNVSDIFVELGMGQIISSEDSFMNLTEKDTQDSGSGEGLLSVGQSKASTAWGAIGPGNNFVSFQPNKDVEHLG